MKYRIAKSIARAVSAKPEREDVHFHLDSDGRPFVCDDARCESPALSHGEVGFIRN
jgi:hypothetical protein